MVTLPRQAKRGRHIQATIPVPYEDLKSLRATAVATKELVETLAGQRGQAFDVAVTWQDLLNLGWIRQEEIPYDIGSHPFQQQG